ncbi:hypothetical protein Nepgr_002713 [Nepenthes gracilis]|uniref:Uncharacterized protein n=1 Tax=Nepenthes gracilis TaxID=150966 RepID=A0AAD3RY01_NEPGR|nr:hypothetical protein Nepgr_002713 [Nepenthes gracilis]
MEGLNATDNSQFVSLGEAIISVSEQEVSDSIPKEPLELAMPSESAKEVPKGMEFRNSDMQEAISNDCRVGYLVGLEARSTDNVLDAVAHEDPCSAHIESPAIEAIAGTNGVQFDEVGVPHCYNDDGGESHCHCKGPVGALCIQSQHLEGPGCNAGENWDIESDPDDSNSQSSEEWTDEVIAKDHMHYALRCLLGENASQLHFKSITMDQRDPPRQKDEDVRSRGYNTSDKWVDWHGGRINEEPGQFVPLDC